MLRLEALRAAAERRVLPASGVQKELLQRPAEAQASRSEAPRGALQSAEQVPRQPKLAAPRAEPLVSEAQPEQQVLRRQEARLDEREAEPSLLPSFG